MNRSIPILFCALVVAACGGGGSSADSVPAPEVKRLAEPELGEAGSYLAWLAGAPAHYTDPNRPDGIIVTADNTPADNPLTDAGARLGRVLFYDVALSAGADKHCGSCHQADAAFGDTGARSTRADGTTTLRNTPALVNVRFFASGRMGWTESQPSLELQALDAMTVELSSALDELPARLSALAYYPPLFTAAFGDPAITTERIGKALAQFQRAIVSYGSRHDQALAGGGPPNWAGVFTPAELRGMALFRPVPLAEQIALGIAGSAADEVRSLQCHLCHQTAAQILTVAGGATAITSNPDVEGVGPQNIGLALTADDPGIAGEGRFKVPSLRNVALSAPYMHDGRFATLDEVIQHYSSQVIDTPNTSHLLRVGLVANAPVRRTPLTSGDIEALKAFLGTLTDPSLATEPLFADPFLPPAGG
ncbi:MAG: cytochrome c peroxidase [Burkholderiaceae bacterium]